MKDNNISLNIPIDTLQGSLISKKSSVKIIKSKIN